MPPGSAPFPRQALEQVRFAVISLGVSLLPEELKRHERVEPYASLSTVIAGAVVEMFLALAVFGVTMVGWVGRFSAGPGWEALASMPSLDTGHFLGVGALAYLSFLLTPQGIVLVYFVAEGIVRALEGSLSQRMLGTAPAWAAWRLALLLDRRARAVRIALLVGPDRPDEVVLPERSVDGMLEIYSVEQKPWSEVQVVELGGGFYQLASRDLVPRGPHHAFRYLLHEMEEREVIRGRIVRFEEEAARRACHTLLG